MRAHPEAFLSLASADLDVFFFLAAVRFSTKDSFFLLSPLSTSRTILHPIYPLSSGPLLNIPHLSLLNRPASRRAIFRQGQRQLPDGIPLRYFIDRRDGIHSFFFVTRFIPPSSLSVEKGASWRARSDAFFLSLHSWTRPEILNSFSRFNLPSATGRDHFLSSATLLYLSLSGFIINRTAKLGFSFS